MSHWTFIDEPSSLRTAAQGEIMGKPSQPLNNEQLKEKLEQYSERIPFSGCAIWTRATNGISEAGRGGYPLISLNDKGKRKYAHRLSYELHKGQIPNGMMVCHSCDVRACVNPNHLFVGTGKENSDDRDRKGRGIFHGAPGERNRKARLTAEDVTNIRRMRKEGFSVHYLADLYKITSGYVWNLCSRNAWKHIP